MLDLDKHHYRDQIFFTGSSSRETLRPDALFKSPMAISGQMAYWIDRYTPAVSIWKITSGFESEL